jgi:glutathione S-transferase
MLKILGRKTSSNVMKVLWACVELDIEYERTDIGGKFGGNDTPEYLALNPNGLVPTIIEEDGFTLWESNSCVRYLASTHDFGGLYPDDPKVRASAERWMDWQIGILSPALRPVFRGFVRTPEAERDLPSMMASRDKLSHSMSILDRYLADSAFVAGDTFTVGDIAVGIGTWRWFNLPIERESYPNLERWFEALKQRPGYQEHVMLPMA